MTAPNSSEPLKSAYDRNLAALNDVTVFLAIVTPDFDKDPYCALQVGIALIQNKPLVVVVDKSAKIPEPLVRAAHSVTRVDIKDAADIQRAVGNILSMMGPAHGAAPRVDA